MGTGGNAGQVYGARATGFKERLAALDRRGAALANGRTVTFLGFLGPFLAVVFELLPRWGLWPAFASLLGYVSLAVVHARVLREEARTKVLVALNERGLARLDGSWRKFKHQGAGLVPDGHLYAADLDVVGQGSLFQRLDETGTKAGEAQVAAWLAQAGAGDEVRARQGAVQELAQEVDFRQALVTEARMAGEDKADPSRFIAWAEGPPGLESARWAWPVAHLLPALTLGFGVAAALELVSALPFWIGVALQVGVVALTRKAMGRTYEAIAISEHGFVRFEDTFKAVDGQRLQHPLLVALQAGIQKEGPPVSERLRRFARLLGFAELRQSGQLHPIINALLLWDVHVLFRIERWRVAHGAGVRRWFDALAQLEALSSFAGFAFENPAYAWPQVEDAPVRFEATGLGHPLLERPVVNDVRLEAPGRALIITGSNMSGKTTLMRAVGLNTVMALAGLPVCAAALRVSRAQVMTSMRVKDSLERGVSYFYAEVQRIKTLLETARAHPKACLFLLDELFMGTNTRERQIASKQLLGLLLETGAAGAVTTHDLTLCELEQERPGAVKNVHFRDQIEQGEMTFDYRLREGIVQTSNALEVLRRAGVPV